MQSKSLSKSKSVKPADYAHTAHLRRKRRSLLSYLPLVLSGLLVFVVSTAIFYFSWDYMPGRIRYLPRYLEIYVLPERPHDDYVAAPSVAIAPEDTLKSLQLAPVATEIPAAPTTVSAPVAQSAAPATESGSAVEQEAPASEAPVEVAPPADVPVVEEPAVEEPAIEEAVAEAPAVEALPAAQPEVAAAPLYQPPQPVALLEGIRHEYQGWNNCGPTTLAMNLSYFGRTDTQEQTAPFLKPDEDDKNVNPNEMVAYAHSIGYGAKVVVGADIELLRTLVTNGIPVTVESWHIEPGDDQMGHYLLLRGYEGDTLHFYDSLNGPNITESVAEFDELWKVFNRTAVVVWPPEKEELVAAILGNRNDPRAMYEHALHVAHEEVNADPHDKFAWFNLGTNLIALGDVENAVRAFDTARSLQLPWRMLWYQFGPYEAYYNVGNYQEVINLATTTIQGAGNLEESFYWRGRAYAALGQTDAARRDYQEAIQLNANFAPAHDALATLS